MTLDPSERRYDSFDDARPAVTANNPDWSDGDIVAKAHALTEDDPAYIRAEDDPAYIRAVLLRDGPYDAGCLPCATPTPTGDGRPQPSR